MIQFEQFTSSKRSKSTWETEYIRIARSCESSHTLRFGYSKGAREDRHRVSMPYARLSVGLGSSLYLVAMRQALKPVEGVRSCRAEQRPLKCTAWTGSSAGPHPSGVEGNQILGLTSRAFPERLEFLHSEDRDHMTQPSSQKPRGGQDGGFAPIASDIIATGWSKSSTEYVTLLIS